MTIDCHNLETTVRCVHLLPDTIDAGAENQARYLIAGLAAEPGLSPEIVYFGAGRAHKAFASIGVPMHRIGRKRRLWLDLPRRARLLRRHLGREPAILHTWLLEGNIVGLFAARRMPNLRVVITQRGGVGELDWPVHVRAQRLLRHRVDHAISNSTLGEQVLRGLGVPAERISVIANGVPCERVQPRRSRSAVRRELGIGEETSLAVWVGRVGKRKDIVQKGLGDILSVAAAFEGSGDNVVFVLVGPEAAELGALGLTVPSNVLPIGWRSDVADHIAAADAVVISSLREANSNVAAEALLLGITVVTTSVGDHHRLVAEAGGTVIPPGDPLRLAEGLRKALSAPPDPNRVRHVARRACSMERVIADTRSVYERLLTTKVKSSEVV